MFRSSVWYTRGWTLQELIAPSNLIFVSSDWDAPALGSKADLASLVEEITKVRQDVLLDRRMLRKASVAQKMSWAASRCTTRPEDEAYSLLGLFGVNMATIYGEGRRAFRRLQEEIMRRTPDHSIFAWDASGESVGMLASSPHQFADSAGYEPMELGEFHERFRLHGASSWDLSHSITNVGLHIQLPAVEIPDVNMPEVGHPQRFRSILMAYLRCVWNRTDAEGHLAAVFLRPRIGWPKGHYNRVSFRGHTVIHESAPRSFPSLMSLWISEE